MRQNNNYKYIVNISFSNAYTLNYQETEKQSKDFDLC